ncbi:MAG: replication-associated recombination protein A, partial [Actinobacteria bacterium]|nr:replication-associated recombination protein A [Actinomycetota bacterium]
MNNKPLADRMRPQTIKDVVGQKHLLAKGMILRELIDKKELTSLIFWG